MSTAEDTLDDPEDRIFSSDSDLEQADEVVDGNVAVADEGNVAAAVAGAGEAGDAPSGGSSNRTSGGDEGPSKCFLNALLF
jgi:hypothetical protein